MTLPKILILPTAINNASVMAGDTIHVEPSATAYPGFTLNAKHLVIIGNGYFLTENPGLQANTLNSSITVGGAIVINGIPANNSTIMGLVATNVRLTNVSDITIAHCLITSLSFQSYSNITGTGIQIRKCFIVSMSSGAGFSGTGSVELTIENNIFSAATGQVGTTIVLATTASGLFRNNTINTGLNNITLNNFYIANNIFTVSSTAAIGGGNNISKYNLHAGNGLPTDPVDNPGNVNGVDMTLTLVGPLTTGTGDARFKLRTPSSLADAAGETIGAVVTPACGAYGATDPYRLSGIPSIPTIYLLTVPSTVPSASATMDITVSTRSNN